MNSQTTLAAKQYRIQEWTNMVRECNSSPENMTVTEWCKSHSITKCDYYYRMRMVRKACLDALPKEAPQNVIIPVSTELMEQKEAPVPVPNNSDLSSIELITNGITLHVTEQTSPILLSKVLGVIAHVE